jgi:hypothetical protein
MLQESLLCQLWILGKDPSISRPAELHPAFVGNPSCFHQPRLGQITLIKHVRAASLAYSGPDRRAIL